MTLPADSSFARTGAYGDSSLNPHMLSDGPLESRVVSGGKVKCHRNPEHPALFPSPRANGGLPRPGADLSSRVRRVRTHTQNDAVGGFQPPGEPRGIEQRAGGPIAVQALLYRGEKLRLRRQPKCEFLIVFRGAGDEIGQTDRVQQASGDAPGKCRTDARDNRQAGPKRVRSRRAAIVVERVQREVGASLARQILVQADPFRENQPIRVHTPLPRILSQISSEDLTVG